MRASCRWGASVTDWRFATIPLIDSIEVGSARARNRSGRAIPRSTSDGASAKASRTARRHPREVAVRRDYAPACWDRGWLGRTCGRVGPGPGLDPARGRGGGDGDGDRLDWPDARRLRDALANPAGDHLADVGDARGTGFAALPPRRG